MNYDFLRLLFENLFKIEANIKDLNMITEFPNEYAAQAHKTLLNNLIGFKEVYELTIEYYIKCSKDEC